MDPIHLQLQMLKEFYGSSDPIEIRDPMHPAWHAYDHVSALSGQPGLR
jgi:hypothetical protein